MAIITINSTTVIIASIIVIYISLSLSIHAHTYHKYGQFS